MAAAAAPNYAPAPVQDFGTLSTINPAQSAQGANVTAAQSAGGAPVQDYQTQAALIDPNSAYAQENQMYAAQAAALAPQFQQQNSQLADANAARGITNSGAGAQLQANLYGQQAGVLSGADAQFTSQGAAFNQQDLQSNQAAQNAANMANQQAGIQTGEYNSTQQQQNNQYNASNQQQAGEYNSSNQQQSNQFNATNQNNALNYNADINNQAILDNWQATNQYNQNSENQQYNLANEGYEAYLNSLAPSTTAEQGYNNAAGYANQSYDTAYQGAINQQDAALGAAGAAAGGFNWGGGGGGYTGPAPNSGSFGSWGESPYQNDGQ